MRVAVISRVFSRSGGGAESYSVALVQQLATKHEIHVFAQESDQPVSGVTYHCMSYLSEKPRWINQLVFAVTTWWRTRKGFDVVHSHENTWHGQIQTIHVRPLLYNLLNGRTGWQCVLHWFKVGLSPRLIAYVWLEAARFKAVPGRCVVATSDTLKHECEQAYPNSSSLLSVITPGTQFVSPVQTPEAARSQLGLPLGVPLLLFVANDYARKGLDTLLHALSKLPCDVHLAVVGNPKLIPRYRDVAQKLGVLERLHFLGSLSDLTPAYRAADCLAHPTLEDSFAMVVLEAMAIGLPVVVSGPKYCGISSHLQDGQQAMLLFDPGDAIELAKLLNAVLHQPVLAKQLIECARRFAQNHTWESAASQYDVLYQQVRTISQ